MAIEILENTLLKLLVRRGTDSDRQEITLQSGELGYATDTERLYIGNSTTPGGVIVGNLYKGRAALATSLSPVTTGDYVYEISSNSLKVCIQGTGSDAGDWLTVSNQISAGDTTIEIDGKQWITVGTLSAGNFHANALGSSIELDGSNKIALSGTINIDSITQRTTGATNYLSLPGKLKIGTVNYTFPETSPTNNSFLNANANGQLSWGPYKVIESTVAPTTASLIPVATIVPFASGAADVPYGWLSCDGDEYISTSYPDLSHAIGKAYNTGGETSTDYFRVPNLNNKVMYGFPDPGDDGKDGSAATSTLMGVTTSSPAYSTQTLLSATGMHYMIKAIGGVTSPTLTVGKNLSAFLNSVDKTETSFNPLSGSIVIESPPPGQVVFDDGLDTGTFTMPDGIHYVKFFATGAGAKGAYGPGGAGATCIGHLSAAPGTEFKVKCARGPTIADNAVAVADNSVIYAPDNTILVDAGGGRGVIDDIWHGNTDEFQQPADDSGEGGFVASGLILTSSDYVLNGYIVPGASGFMDTSDAGNEESLGAASYWGTAPAPGGGQGAHGYNKSPCGGAFGTIPGNGIVMFEWS